MMNCRYHFGPEGDHAAVDGYVRVTPASLYDPAAGYGFEPHEPEMHVSAADRGEGGMLNRDFCIPVGAAYRMDVPDGLYTVHVTIGDCWYETDTTIKGAAGQLLASLRTPPGHFERVSFTMAAEGGSLKLLFGGRAPRLNALTAEPAGQACRIFLAGDSTVANQPADSRPYAGWGQLLPAFVKPDAAVLNHAMSGRSSKSFIDEGRLDAIWEAIRPGDYLLVQFGHNDQKRDEARYTDPRTTYPAYLRRYIDGARERGAVPVLVTPVQRRTFDAAGRIEDTLAEYSAAMRQLAEDADAALLDLAEMSRELYEQLGPEPSKSLFMWGAPGEFIRFPNGLQDNTHFQERGGLRIAGLVAEGLKALNLQPLRLFLR